MKFNLRKMNREIYDEFLPTVANIFKIARIFGISKYGCNLAFAWTFMLFIMLISLEVTALWKFIKVLDGWASDISGGRGFAARFSGSMFYGNATVSLILSCKFVNSWTRLSKHWRRVETEGSLRFPPDHWVRWKVTVVSAFVGVCALMEHILSIISAIGLDCTPSQYLRKYILSSHGFLMRINEYRLWFAIPIFILSKVSTMLWNFQDLMIIVISMGLTSRYKRLNTYVGHIITIERKLSDTPKTGTDLHVHTEIWRRIREAYVRQANMVRMVDRELGALVLLSNINNLFFICLQLFLGLNATVKGSSINKLYYFISLGWMMFRACGVVIAASEVHMHSKKALVHLYSCPKSGFNIEAKRLKHQLIHDHVGLSGMGLFSLKRQLLLQFEETSLYWTNSQQVTSKAKSMAKNHCIAPNLKRLCGFSLPKRIQRASKGGRSTKIKVYLNPPDIAVSKVAAAVLKYELVLIQYDK